MVEDISAHKYMNINIYKADLLKFVFFLYTESHLVHIKYEG